MKLFITILILSFSVLACLFQSWPFLVIPYPKLIRENSWGHRKPMM